MPKVQYLKQRGTRWWFQLSVPERLRSSFRKSIIEENLRTRDAGAAQVKALERASYWKQQFDLHRAVDTGRPAEVYQANYAEALRKIDWINHKFHDEDDRDFQLDLLEDSVLQPEMRRLGYIDRSEIKDGDLDPEAEVAFRAIVAARRGEREVPAEYRTPVSKLAAAFIADRQRDPRDRLTAQTVAQMEAVFRLFRDHIDDGALSTVDKRVATEFFDRVKLLDRHWGRSGETKSRTLDQLVAAARTKEVERLSNRTLKRYASSLVQLWEWAERRGDVAGSAPFDVPATTKRKGGRRQTANAPWPKSALRTYFEAQPDQSRRGHPDPFYWLPMVALLSGMRLNEICSLEAEDVRTADGVAYFDIPEGKAEGSIRVVPVHSALRPLLKFAPKTGYLFPDLTPGGLDQKRSWNIGKRLGRRFRQVAGASTFHGFRKNVAETFERSRIPETEASQLLGHKKAGITYGVYSPNGLTIKQKRDLVELLVEPPC